MTTECKPYGDPDKPIWFLGHDPRLRKNDAEAETCFFLDLLDKPTKHGEGSRRRLARATMDYLARLADRPVVREEIYVTNLCNGFLERPERGGVVLIPNPVADYGVDKIRRALLEAQKRPRVIIASSQQVLYHLARTRFVEPSAALVEFTRASTPRLKAAARGEYTPSRGAAFLAVCGQRLLHDGIPLIPVLHISSFCRMNSRYREPMARAAEIVKSALNANGAS